MRVAVIIALLTAASQCDYLDRLLTSVAECADTTDDCTKIADLCNDTDFKDVMTKRCPKTCGFCSCVDIASFCNDTKNDCNDPDIGSIVRDKCPKSCGLCTTSGWQYWPNTNNWYWFTDNAGPRSAVDTMCATEGGTLVSIHSQAENDYVKSLINSNAWIGLHYTSAWQWLDSTPYDFSNWYNENHYFDCVYIYADDGKWSTENCSVVLKGVCKKPN